MQKKFIGFKIPKATKTDKSTWVSDEFDTTPHLVNTDNFYYFILNREKQTWAIPQKCQNDDENDIKIINSLFRSIKNKYIINLILHELCDEIVGVVILEKRQIDTQEKKSLKKQLHSLSLHHEKRRKDELPVYKQGYSTDWWKKYDNFQNNLKNEKKKEINFEPLQRKGYSIIANRKQVQKF
jgi:hypothetical protein